jgi:hypothetical protein
MRFAAVTWQNVGQPLAPFRPPLPLNDGVMTIPGIREETEGEVAAVVDGIINSAGRGVLKGFK